MTYAKLYGVGAIHELPLPENKGFGYFLRKSYTYTSRSVQKAEGNPRLKTWD